jgi:hypothetical protein
MGLTEELKSLEEMNVKGTLTSDEFIAAKAAALSNAKTPPAAQQVRASELTSKKSANTGIKLFVLACLLAIIWFIVSLVGKPTDVLKMAARLPIDLTNEVESVHAHSWRAVTIQVPYDGSLTITAQVQRGNPIQIFLVDNAGMDKLKSGDRTAYYVGGFFAPQASTFQHTGRLNRGTYYLVLRDWSLGILSATSSDVAVKARIEP